MKRLFEIVALSALALLFAACDSGGSANVDGGPDGGDPGPDYVYPIEDIAVNWEPCSFKWGENDGDAECASTPMPLFWNDPDNGKTLAIAAKRRLSAAAESDGQIWFLHGGPGASGVEGLPGLMEKIQDLYPQLDVYTIDHRGVGDSGKIVCPGDDDPYQDHLPECLIYLEEEYGDDLAAYSTSDSAIDVAAYIEATREEGKKVLIWGGSYGTYLAHRYLQIFPDQSDGVVLEGIAPADSTFIWSSEEFDKAGKNLFDKCRYDDYCVTKLGKDPLVAAKLMQIMIYNQGHCSQMNDYQYYIPYAITSLLYYHPYHNAIPAIVYRALRCEPGDINAMYSLIDMIYGSDSSYQDLGDGYSGSLYNNVVYSEMWEHPNWPDEESLLDYFAQVEAQSVFGSGSGEYMYERYEVWPKYNDELWDDKWAQTDTPLLMLQGVLDPATSYDHALPYTEHFSNPTQTWAAFPTAPHNVSSGTPVSDNPDDLHCGRSLMVEFLKDPQAALDLSCMDDVLTNNFEGDEELADMMFGAAHLWENGVSYAAEPGSWKRRTEWKGSLRELRVRARRDLARGLSSVSASSLPSLPPLPPESSP